ncbi:serine/threonine protein kinase [Kaarinaea lacus]
MDSGDRDNKKSNSTAHSGSSAERHQGYSLEAEDFEKTRVSIPGHADDETVAGRASGANLEAADKYDDATVVQTGGQGVRASNPDTSTSSNGGTKKAKPVLKKRFELESVIGSGGMGTVYKARDLRKVEAKDLEPYVAVKVLGKALKNHPHAFVALQREAKKSQKLAHPNILTVHDFDRDGDITFMTMELLHGESLDKSLSRHKGKGLPYKKAIKIIKDFSAALEYAHQHGIIHLDFKPGNIFVGENNTKVLDFGIARLTKDKKDPKDFDAGALNALTPAYASLEMLKGEDPDPRDDVFAAAVICYELLAGEHPFGKKPANQAAEEKLKPKRIKALKKRQWKALESALAFQRESRTASVKQFINAFTQAKQRHFMQAAAVLAITGAGAWFAYQNYFAPDELSLMVEKTMGKATQCFDAKDYLCAIENAKAVVNMRPNHGAAQQLLAQAQQSQFMQEVEAIVTQADQCLNRGDLSCVLAHVGTLKEKDPGNKDIDRLRNQVSNREQQLFVDTTVAKAQACLDKKNYQCAIAESEAVLAIDGENISALKIKSIAQDKVIAIEKETRRIAELVGSKLMQANECFKQKKYQCVIENTNVVLKHKPGDDAAVALKQNSLFALQVIAEDEKRVSKILETGQSCFNRKDYSCAIAKSESALEIIPTHDAAMALKQQATEAIRKLKDSITIQ